MSAPLKRRILPASKQQNVVKTSVKEQKIDRTILLFSADSVRRNTEVWSKQAVSSNFARYNIYRYRI